MGLLSSAPQRRVRVVIVGGGICASSSAPFILPERAELTVAPPPPRSRHRSSSPPPGPARQQGRPDDLRACERGRRRLARFYLARNGVRPPPSTPCPTLRRELNLLPPPCTQRRRPDPPLLPLLAPQPGLLVEMGGPRRGPRVLEAHRPAAPARRPLPLRHRVCQLAVGLARPAAHGHVPQCQDGRHVRFGLRRAHRRDRRAQQADRAQRAGQGQVQGRAVALVEVAQRHASRGQAHRDRRQRLEWNPVRPPSARLPLVLLELTLSLSRAGSSPTSAPSPASRSCSSSARRATTGPSTTSRTRSGSASSSRFRACCACTGGRSSTSTTRPSCREVRVLGRPTCARARPRCVTFLLPSSSLLLLLLLSLRTPS